VELNKNKILLVDDEPDILEFLKYNLKREGFEIFTAKNGKEAIKTAEKELPGLIILDVMMPEMDGMETCIQLRENPLLKAVIILFLTARHEDYSQIAGFDAGADDYVTKPVKPRVLISRVKALLRRLPGSETVMKQAHTKDFGGISIDKEKYIVTKDGKEFSFPKKEFELLDLFASKPGKVFSRDEILNRVWGDDVVVGDRTIDVHVRKLREKLGEEYIKTVKGVGYKFEF
jgi:two-component system, OmpR family, alkaline phosphatase synthesis response regulator PhoP